MVRGFASSAFGSVSQSTPSFSSAAIPHLPVDNAAERALRGIAVGRRNWTFCGSDSGGQRAAAIYTLIETCKLNDVDPRAWLADILARIADHPAKRIGESCHGTGRSPVPA